MHGGVLWGFDPHTHTHRKYFLKYKQQTKCFLDASPLQCVDFAQQHWCIAWGISLAHTCLFMDLQLWLKKLQNQNVLYKVKGEMFKLIAILVHHELKIKPRPGVGFKENLAILHQQNNLLWYRDPQYTKQRGHGVFHMQRSTLYTVWRKLNTTRHNTQPEKENCKLLFAV